jgi:flagellar assembly protein FliH
MRTVENETTTRVEIFEYPASDNPPRLRWNDLSEIGSSPASMRRVGHPDECKDSESTITRSPTGEEIARSFEAGREQGTREARDAAAFELQTHLEKAEKNRIDLAADLASQLGAEKDRFFQTMEHEVVRLSLAIAARILRREAQIDPLFLVGAVRVALGQVAKNTHVKLLVPASEAGLWIETIAHVPNLRTAPVVVPDDSMQLGDCSIETEMGSVDLGLNAQLHESERILFPNPRPEALENSTPLDSHEEEMRT